MHDHRLKGIVAIRSTIRPFCSLISILVLVAFATTGCGRTEPLSSDTDATAEASGSIGETQSSRLLAEPRRGDESENLIPPTAIRDQSASFDPLQSADRSIAADSSRDKFLPANLSTMGVTGERSQLRPDWGPRELYAFLGDIDRDLGALINNQSGIKDQAAIKDEVVRSIALKKAAAEKLSQHPDATPRDQITGHRGVLQALSHLASIGDLKAAEELLLIAKESRESPNAALRSDGLLVLIGLEIESLRHGKLDAAERVLVLVHELLDADQDVDVATLMVLGQAKDALLLYDHQDEATEVRDLIVKRFGRAQDAEVARMAALIAAAGFSQSNTALERLDKLRQEFVTAATADPENTADNRDAAERVDPAAWRSAMNQVLSTPPDVLTVEFLCGASLEAEAVGRTDIAEATYDKLQEQFAERQDAMGRVARTALRARENRMKVIGQKFDPDLPSVDGRTLKMDDYRGKVVLMPFWSSAFPDSLAVLPNLLEIQKQNPDRVAIVGMNLDVVGTEVAGFAKREGLEFPSFRSVSDPGAEIVNEVAYRFGAVTLLFVAVMDGEGKVVYLDFSGEDLTSEVQKLIR